MLLKSFTKHKSMNKQWMQCTYFTILIELISAVVCALCMYQRTHVRRWSPLEKGYPIMQQLLFTCSNLEFQYLCIWLQIKYLISGNNQFFGEVKRHFHQLNAWIRLVDIGMNQFTNISHACLWSSETKRKFCWEKSFWCFSSSEHLKKFIRLWKVKEKLYWI